MAKKYKPLYREFWESNKQMDLEGSYYMSCVNCDKRVYEPFVVVHNFSHIVSKGAAPELALDPSNIEFLCTQCHTIHHMKGQVDNQLMPNA